ncbi:hypothetical protein HPP92_001683 [Vanilla planifolia]|uniref:DUF761 domain-containing protein n=1 Tax=Vanilla planifolia TaxID=51239 RepID=A0A835VM24_VANPL|nr:hypothetical protein HPP92_001683 [Vanilla planifolia]
MARALKGKATAVKTRIIIFKLLRDRNALLRAFPTKNSEIGCEDQRSNEDPGELLILRDVVSGVPVGRVEDKQTKEDETEQDLEEEIDQAADLFIRRFHTEMMIQKQDSFKRYQEMLARGM